MKGFAVFRNFTMSRYCEICQRQFISDYGLTQHLKSKHYKMTYQLIEPNTRASQQQTPTAPKYDRNLWSMPIFRPSSKNDIPRKIIAVRPPLDAEVSINSDLEIDSMEDELEL